MAPTTNTAQPPQNGPPPPTAPVTLTGTALTLPDLISVALRRRPCHMTTDPKILHRIQASVDFLAAELATGKAIYGINTGFGGSADVTTEAFGDLQKSLLQFQHCGILLPGDGGCHGGSEDLAGVRSHALPRPVVRGAMLTRCNSLMRGHSAVRVEVIRAIMTLLQLDFLPVIPLRGSISASGDLMPLSYIGGALEGNPDIFLDCAKQDGREVLSADSALERAGLAPITLGPKEGLGIVNGTSVSVSAAVLGYDEARSLCGITQALTGMCVEALCGSTDSFHPFSAECRPHAGQTRVASNIRRFLEGSQLARGHRADVAAEGANTTGLCQDRYALRTASQWIGPYLEDLDSASRQLEVELNSTTDNPLVDLEGQRIHHGGNFQATSITSATEKIRLAIQMFGKLIFAQSSELIDGSMNGSLTPNLCFDEPSISFTCKGLNINMTAYMSELAFLANPVSSHVQSAEMGNQSVNSLALVSARYTMDAAEVAWMMMAVHLYTLCQALDLQAMQREALTSITDQAKAEFERIFGSLFPVEPGMLKPVLASLTAALVAFKSSDIPDRARRAAEATVVPLLDLLRRQCPNSDPVAKGQLLGAIERWQCSQASLIESNIRDARERFSRAPSTMEYLGHGSRILYSWVRHALGVPLHRGIVDHATIGSSAQREAKKTIGSWVSKIYCALRNGEMERVLEEALAESE